MIISGSTRGPGALCLTWSFRDAWERICRDLGNAAEADSVETPPDTRGLKSPKGRVRVRPIRLFMMQRSIQIGPLPVPNRIPRSLSYGKSSGTLLWAKSSLVPDDRPIHRTNGRDHRWA